MFSRKFIASVGISSVLVHAIYRETRSKEPFVIDPSYGLFELYCRIVSGRFSAKTFTNLLVDIETDIWNDQIEYMKHPSIRLNQGYTGTDISENQQHNYKLKCIIEADEPVIYAKIDMNELMKLELRKKCRQSLLKDDYVHLWLPMWLYDTIVG